MHSQSIALGMHESIDLLSRQALQATISSMLETIAERIQYVLEQSKISKAEIARRCEVSSQAVTGWIKTGRISKKCMYILSKSTGFNSDWISTGMGPERAAASSNTVHEETRLYGASIPVVGIAQLGPDGFWDDGQYPQGHGDGVVVWPSGDEDAYSLQCKGESMSPRIRHGEYVVVEPNHVIIPGDEVRVKTIDGQSMIKIFLYERDGRVHLDSVNNHFGQTIIDRDQIDKFHYVAGIAKAALHRNK